MEIAQVNILNTQVLSCDGFADCVQQQIPQLLLEHLKLWNPELDESQLKMISIEEAIWEDGSLGAPMPGECYTQELVPGFRIVLELGNEHFEVHTNHDQNLFAIPGYGFI